MVQTYINTIPSHFTKKKMTNNCNSFISKIEIQNESMQWNYSWNLRDLMSFLDPKD